MIDRFAIELPHGISLSCRASGPEGAPVLLFLHGFPEAAFVWDGMLRHFSSHYRCVAPNLRGYEHSSAPAEVEAYRAKHLVADVAALVEQLGGRLEALIAHDWGGALAWNFATLHPQRLQRLVIINSPHPAVFLRELQHNPLQQAASAYMNFLCRPDADRLLEEDDFARLWPFFSMFAGGPADWLSEAVKEQYRTVWRAGLRGPVNFYRASPLRPPTQDDQAVMRVQMPKESVTVKVPAHVVWAEGDAALLPGLLEGLDEFVPRLTLTRIPGATHWVIHERPAQIAQEIETALQAPGLPDPQR